jgi:hypothetical protein
MRQVSETLDYALAAGVKRFANRRGVPGKGIGWGERIDKKFGGEARLGFSRSAHTGGVEKLGNVLAEQQILLSQHEIRWILLIGSIGEPFVPCRHRDWPGVVTADRAADCGPERPGRPPIRRVLAAMIPAGFFSVIPEAISSSRSMSVESEPTVKFSVMPAKSSRTECQEDCVGVCDEVMSTLQLKARATSVPAGVASDAGGTADFSAGAASSSGAMTAGSMRRTA